MKQKRKREKNKIKQDNTNGFIKQKNLEVNNLWQQKNIVSITALSPNNHAIRGHNTKHSCTNFYLSQTNAASN